MGLSAPALALPNADLDALRRRVRHLAESRPAVYRMIDPAGRTLYVGKAKRLRARLLSYFRARYPEDKASRILHAAATIDWTYVPSEFAALLTELRLIQRHRPPFNVRMNRRRRAAFVRLSAGPAPKVYAGRGRPRDGERSYGPIASPRRLQEGIRTLSDLLGLRDCALSTPIVFAGQGDLFAADRRAGCLRHELGTCAGPCAGLVSEHDYERRTETAVAFLEGRTIRPIDRCVEGMESAAASEAFERAARWREKYESLEWLLAALARARAAVDLLTFVYRDPGAFGDDRAYLIRRGTVRATFPYPTTPIEREAFRGVVADHLARPEASAGPLPHDDLDEILLLMAWFRSHRSALRRTTPLEEWVH